MKQNLILLCTLTIVLPGCLTTRAELRETEVKRPTISAAQERQAQTASRLDDYDAQFRSFNGRMDLAENQISQINAGHADRMAQEQKRRDEIDKRFKAYEEALGKLESQVSNLEGELNALKQQKERKETAPSSGKDSLATADAAFDQKDWKTAIVEYENYRRSYPKGKHYPMATLRIGASFQELNKKEEAKVFLEEVIAKFPKSNEAKKASQRLKTMK